MYASYNYNYTTGTSYPKKQPYNGTEGYAVPKRNQIYSTGLMNLTRRTTRNLEILKDKLIRADPCYEYGMEHWHSSARPHGTVHLNTYCI